MNFNVYKIKFIDKNDIEMEENIHSASEKNAIIKLKSEYKVSKIIKVMYMSSTHEMKKVYGLKWIKT